jgi:hypothetical protein
VLEDRIQAAAEGMLPPNPEDALGDAATIAAIIRAEDKLRADTGNALSM